MVGDEQKTAQIAPPLFKRTEILITSTQSHGENIFQHLKCRLKCLWATLRRMRHSLFHELKVILYSPPPSEVPQRVQVCPF